jgi:hypothetical protein
MIVNVSDMKMTAILAAAQPRGAWLALARGPSTSTRTHRDRPTAQRSHEKILARSPTRRARAMRSTVDVLDGG